MAGIWDSAMKNLISVDPQDFVSWLIPGGRFIRELTPHLKRRHIDADGLYDIIINERHALLHVEFQKKAETDMAARLWEYNTRATRQNKQSVRSFVIYLKKCKCAESPFLQMFPDGREIHRFNFDVIKLWELPTEGLKQAAQPGLLPLLTLTKEGARREVVDDIIDKLLPLEEEPGSELLYIAYTLAALVFTSEQDRAWLKRRFEMLGDILEDSWAHQEFMQKMRDKGLEQGLQQGREQGREQGLQQGREQGLEQGRLEEQREMLVEIVKARFPDCVALAQEVVRVVDNPDALRHVNIKISIARSEDEARRLLLKMHPESN
ncbi:MAG: hypothetical protein ABI456_11985 [Ktedonobacteraceae bacterium]|nr:hypothetical protein [Chloroflexota bacterium]